MQEDPPAPTPDVVDPTPEPIGESEQVGPEPEADTSLKPHHRLARWYGSHKKLSIPVTLILIILILGAVPFTRYQIAGLFLKKNFTIAVRDSTAHTPVSGVSVYVGSSKVVTNAEGMASVRLRVGSHDFSLSKNYYQNDQVGLLVPILKEKTPTINMVATGRQVEVDVTNIVGGSPLGGVNISVADTSAKTDTAGKALLVLPAGDSTMSAQLALAGYNNSKVTIKISNNGIENNNFTLTPTGKVYYISNATGQLNVMEANLDGTQPQVAIAATGNENVSDMSLVQSPDGKYVALIAKRTTTDQTPQIYVFAAADNKLLQIDSGDSIFNIYGWSGDVLVYGVQQQSLPSWQQGVGQIKAYDATTGMTTLLDQTAGSDATTNSNEIYNNVVVSGDEVVYSKYWDGDQSLLTGKENTVQVINVDGQGHTVVASYDATDNSQQLFQYNPASFYIDDYQNSTSTTAYYSYTIGSTPKTTTDNPQLSQNNTAYLFSLSGNETFWSDLRDGENTLLVGDSQGNNATTIASLSDYSAYGWYTDNYLLVEKNDSELYVMSVKGGTPVKIADYQSTGNGY